MIKRPRYKKNTDVTNERLRCSHDIMMTQMLVSMMSWCPDKVYRSLVEIIWVVMWIMMYWDHVIGRFRDHNITIAFFLRYKLRWAWRRLSKNLEWKLGEKPPNPIRETKKENQGKMRTSYPRKKTDRSQMIMSLVKNLPTQWGRLGKKTGHGN